MQVPAKLFWKSKTFWLGIAALLLAFLEGVVNLVDLSGTEYAWISGLFGGAIIFLRYVTKMPLTFSGKNTKHVDDRSRLV